VAVTPFLHENFNKSISYGGTVLVMVSVGMAIGSVSSGALLQRKILNQYTIMAIGAFSIGVGLMLAFPPEFIPSFYDLAPILAFPGVLLAGIGDPLMTISTLRALYNLQVCRNAYLYNEAVEATNLYI
jgi:hypothetical protein